jgi:hypothetical protein
MRKDGIITTSVVGRTKDNVLRMASDVKDPAWKKAASVFLTFRVVLHAIKNPFLEQIKTQGGQRVAWDIATRN